MVKMETRTFDVSDLEHLKFLLNHARLSLEQINELMIYLSSCSVDYAMTYHYKDVLKVLTHLVKMSDMTDEIIENMR